MPSQETIDRNTRAVKDALREGNRRCADCAARGPTVACIAFRTFVCQPCANAHRELFPDNKLKSVSLAEFETDEVRGLRQHGNEASRKIWLARWSPSDGEPPAGAPREALKRFLSRKYVDKAWVAGGQPAAPPVPAPRPVAPPPAPIYAAAPAPPPAPKPAPPADGRRRISISFGAKRKGLPSRKASPPRTAAPPRRRRPSLMWRRAPPRRRTRATPRSLV